MQLENLSLISPQLKVNLLKTHRLPNILFNVNPEAHDTRDTIIPI